MSETWPPLPLFDLFLEVREPLGLRPDDYHLLLDALDRGFGCESLDNLKQTCRLLWLKTHDDRTIAYFDAVFDRYVSRNPPQTREEEDRQPGDGSSTTATTADLRPAPTVPRPPQPQQPQPRPLQTLGALREGDPQLHQTSEKGYILKPTDFPFQPRLARRSWRRLRQIARLGTTGNVDIPAAIAAIARDRVCLTVPLEPKRVNLLELVFFIDRDGSMVPFHIPCDRLLATVEPKRFFRVEQYYFRNVPERSVYLRPKGAQTKLLDELLPSLSDTRTAAIVLSDAGAARRGYNTPRVELTEQFLEALRPWVRAIAWLNPMPSERWLGTTAEEVRECLEAIGGGMFELSHDGLNDAVDFVRR
ncbi:hypothetical protein [Baaleninema simplex]|uniref:hypothetical protein n=1 Tax=Baaleninema simplex TaxID=2862350 RepID=UPI00034901C3|nr:hypothetical protein [Baaleninema simplex]